MSLADVIAAIDARFVSANAVPVERAPLKADEWAALREAASALRAGAEPVGYADESRFHELREGRLNLALWAEPDFRAQTPLYTRPQPATPASGEAVAVFDAAVAAELPRVSHVQYDSHEICKHFAGELRKRLTTPPASKGGE